MRDYALHTDMEDEDGNKIVKYVTAHDVLIENAGEAEDTVFLFYRFLDEKSNTIAYYPEQLIQWIDSMESAVSNAKQSEVASALHTASR